MNALIVRRYADGDEYALSRIYNPYVLNTTITFEEVSVSPEEMRDRVKKSTLCLVCCLNNEIIGYVYANRSSPRFRTLDLSVYTDTEMVCQGVGQVLYNAMISQLAETKLSLLANIAVPNERSVRLHTRFDFQRVGYLKKAGYKFDKFIDLEIWQKLP
jgi:L-amino acid N-acyltransferase YncA